LSLIHQHSPKFQQRTSSCFMLDSNSCNTHFMTLYSHVLSQVVIACQSNLLLVFSFEIIKHQSVFKIFTFWQWYCDTSPACFIFSQVPLCTLTSLSDIHFSLLRSISLPLVCCWHLWLHFCYWDRLPLLNSSFLRV